MRNARIDRLFFFGGLASIFTLGLIISSNPVLKSLPAFLVYMGVSFLFSFGDDLKVW